MSRRMDKVLLDAQIDLNTAGYLNVSDCAQLTESAFYVRFQSSSSSGVVKIETADSEDYAGTWAVLATVTWAADATVQYVALTGALRAVRARISTAIGGGGTVTVRMVGNTN